jgi:hypothetical protein
VSVESLQLMRDRVLASRLTWVLLIIAYVGVLLIILAPVLLASVGADDSYWVLEKGPDAGGSVWQAFWVPLSHAFAFDNSRGTALAISDRQVLALVTMKIATTFSIPPMMVWALVKASLLALSIVAVVSFLRQVTFRDARGDVRGLNASSIAFIAIALPLAIAIGAKSQNQGSLNGWNFYPTLTYGTFVGYLLFAALVLKLSTLLQRNFRSWAAPVIIVMVFSAITINLSYELVALMIPISVLVLLLRPRPDETTTWLRWRSAAVILIPLVVTYTTMFVWIRWRMSEMACHATNSCYPGTEVRVEPHTVWNNFLGAFPGNNGAFVGHQATAGARSYPSASALSIGLAVLAAALMWGLWSAWKARQQEHEASDRPTAAVPESNDTRGLWIVLGLSVFIAIGSSVITGITKLAVEALRTPMLAYRNGVATWSALALSGLVCVLLLMRSRWRPAEYAALLALTAVLMGGISLYVPRNIMSAQENRQSIFARFIDEVQREVSLGDTSMSGDARRCKAMSDELVRRKKTPAEGLGRIASAGYKAFKFYHHRPYCSTGIGLPKG